MKLERTVLALPDTVVIESLRVDERAPQIWLKSGIEDYAKKWCLEIAEEVFPAEGDLPACVAQLVTPRVLGAEVWQFDDVEDESE